LKVGFFSPFPPARTGVADYSATLLRALQRLGDVGVNDRGADIFLYHLGNNKLHREIYQRALAAPGSIVLHDAVLQHFFLGSLSKSDYIAEFVYNYGAWSEGLARDLWVNRARSAADPQYFRYPMLRRIVERSLATIVHNPRAAEMVQEHAPGAAIYEIPHLWEAAPSPPEYEVVRLRAELGLRPHVFLFGVFGHLRESKRLPVVLRAFESAQHAADMALLVAGEFVSADLKRTLEPLLDSPRILRIGYTNERDFWRCAAAVDACINLRYPSAGETSGIAIRLMGIGKPVVVTAGCDNSRFPDSACLRVDTGIAEEEMLAEYMVWLARYPEDARTIGRRASEHVRKFHSVERVAGLYWSILQNCYHRRNGNLQ
jgi:glycosyltransferase involved in cell wall biosynthesis